MPDSEAAFYKQIKKNVGKIGSDQPLPFFYAEDKGGEEGLRRAFYLGRKPGSPAKFGNVDKINKTLATHEVEALSSKARSCAGLIVLQQKDGKELYALSIVASKGIGANQLFKGLKALNKEKRLGIGAFEVHKKGDGPQEEVADDRQETLQDRLPLSQTIAKINQLYNQIKAAQPVPAAELDKLSELLGQLDARDPARPDLEAVAAARKWRDEKLAAATQEQDLLAMTDPGTSPQVLKDLAAFYSYVMGEQPKAVVRQLLQIHFQGALAVASSVQGGLPPALRQDPDLAPADRLSTPTITAILEETLRHAGAAHLKQAGAQAVAARPDHSPFLKDLRKSPHVSQRIDALLEERYLQPYRARVARLTTEKVYEDRLLNDVDNLRRETENSKNLAPLYAALGKKPRDDKAASAALGRWVNEHQELAQKKGHIEDKDLPRAVAMAELSFALHGAQDTGKEARPLDTNALHLWMTQLLQKLGQRKDESTADWFARIGGKDKKVLARNIEWTRRSQAMLDALRAHPDLPQTVERDGKLQAAIDGWSLGLVNVNLALERAAKSKGVGQDVDVRALDDLVSRMEAILDGDEARVANPATAYEALSAILLQSVPMLRQNLKNFTAQLQLHQGKDAGEIQARLQRRREAIEARLGALELAARKAQMTNASARMKSHNAAESGKAVADQIRAFDQLLVQFAAPGSIEALQAEYRTLAENAPAYGRMDPRAQKAAEEKRQARLKELRTLLGKERVKLESQVPKLEAEAKKTKSPEALKAHADAKRRLEALRLDEEGIDPSELNTMMALEVDSALHREISPAWDAATKRWDPQKVKGEPWEVQMAYKADRLLEARRQQYATLKADLVKRGQPLPADLAAAFDGLAALEQDKLQERYQAEKGQLQRDIQDKASIDAARVNGAIEEQSSWEGRAQALLSKKRRQYRKAMEGKSKAKPAQLAKMLAEIDALEASIKKHREERHKQLRGTLKQQQISNDGALTELVNVRDNLRGMADESRSELQTNRAQLDKRAADLAGLAGDLPKIEEIRKKAADARTEEEKAKLAAFAEKLARHRIQEDQLKASAGACADLAAAQKERDDARAALERLKQDADALAKKLQEPLSSDLQRLQTAARVLQEEAAQLQSDLDDAARAGDVPKLFRLNEAAKDKRRRLADTRAQIGEKLQSENAALAKRSEDVAAFQDKQRERMEAERLLQQKEAEIQKKRAALAEGEPELRALLKEGARLEQQVEERSGSAERMDQQWQIRSDVAAGADERARRQVVVDDFRQQLREGTLKEDAEKLKKIAKKWRDAGRVGTPQEMEEWLVKQGMKPAEIEALKRSRDAIYKAFADKVVRSADAWAADTSQAADGRYRFIDEAGAEKKLRRAEDGVWLTEEALALRKKAERARADMARLRDGTADLAKMRKDLADLRAMPGPDADLIAEQERRIAERERAEKDVKDKLAADAAQDPALKKFVDVQAAYQAIDEKQAQRRAATTEEEKRRFAQDAKLMEERRKALEQEARRDLDAGTFSAERMAKMSPVLRGEEQLSAQEVQAKHEKRKQEEAFYASREDLAFAMDELPEVFQPPQLREMTEAWEKYQQAFKDTDLLRKKQKMTDPGEVALQIFKEERGEIEDVKDVERYEAYTKGGKDIKKAILDHLDLSGDGAAATLKRLQTEANDAMGLAKGGVVASEVRGDPSQATGSAADLFLKTDKDGYGTLKDKHFGDKDNAVKDQAQKMAAATNALSVIADLIALRKAQVKRKEYQQARDVYGETGGDPMLYRLLDAKLEQASSQCTKAGLDLFKDVAGLVPLAGDAIGIGMTVKDAVLAIAECHKRRLQGSLSASLRERAQGEGDVTGESLQEAESAAKKQAARAGVEATMKLLEAVNLTIQTCSGGGSAPITEPVKAMIKGINLVKEAAIKLEDSADGKKVLALKERAQAGDERAREELFRYAGTHAKGLLAIAAKEGNPLARDYALQASDMSENELKKGSLEVLRLWMLDAAGQDLADGEDKIIDLESRLKQIGTVLGYLTLVIPVASLIQRLRTGDFQKNLQKLELPKDTTKTLAAIVQAVDEDSAALARERQKLADPKLTKRELSRGRSALAAFERDYLAQIQQVVALHKQLQDDNRELQEPLKYLAGRIKGAPTTGEGSQKDWTARQQQVLAAVADRQRAIEQCAQIIALSARLAG